MRTHRLLFAALLVAACGGPSAAPVVPAALTLPDSTTIRDAATGRPVSTADLLKQLEGADYVLLGEVHDNAIMHQVRGALLTAAQSRKPAVVFEQFPATTAPFPPPAAGENEEAWLDQHGFDRKGWKWPLHQPVVDAAIAHARALWGSNVPREALRAVVRGGVDGAPANLRALMQRAPLDSVATAAIDKELLEGHCGKLPESMYPGMRTAQAVRDAAMTEALLQSGADGPAWLIAGNGHVRKDMGVPRMLKILAPKKKVVVVGFLERGAEDTLPSATLAKWYGVVVVTPPAQRPDPCAEM
jgi:uncharacterized iron-regulated protein